MHRDEPPATSAASGRPAEGPAPAQYVTFLHGVGGSPLSWEEQVSKLPAQLPARAPWLRGMRPGSHEEFSLAAAAADIRLSLKLDGVNEGAIVGHSLGAMVALQCAIDDPESVSHLVLVAGQARPSTAMLRTQRFMLRFMPARRLAAQGVSKERLMEALRTGDQFEGAGSLDQVACPTLVVCGARDTANVPASRYIAESVPGARLELVDGAGHDVMHEATAAFNALLYDFLGYPLDQR